MEPRHLTQEQLAELTGLIAQLQESTARLRTIDPTADPDEWVRERHRHADFDARIEEIWPARAEPV
jgi:hypothetical protein